MFTKPGFWNDIENIPEPVKVQVVLAGLPSLDKVNTIRFIPASRKIPAVAFLRNHETGERPVQYKTDEGSFFIEY